MKIEVGKVYLDKSGDKVKILAEADQDFSQCEYAFVGQHKEFGIDTYKADGVFMSDDFSRRDLVKEYKEPVVHARRIAWARKARDVVILPFDENATDAKIYVCAKACGCEVLHIQNISYTEQ